jgi:chromosome segregation ATPase
LTEHEFDNIKQNFNEPNNQVNLLNNELNQQQYAIIKTLNSENCKILEDNYALEEELKSYKNDLDIKLYSLTKYTEENNNLKNELSIKNKEIINLKNEIYSLNVLTTEITASKQNKINKLTLEINTTVNEFSSKFIHQEKE